MARFIALWTRPDDPAAFERHYRETHMPIVDAWPGLRSAHVTRVNGSPMDETPAYHLVFEAEVDDLEALLESEPFSRAAADAGEMMERYGTRATLLTGVEL